MEPIRKPFQGVLNIIRFNWHFYVLAFALVTLLILSANYFDQSVQAWIYVLSFLTLASVLISLLTSFYIYDLSGLYNLAWIEQSGFEAQIVTVSAGFDETSSLLQDKFKNAGLIALDFYDPAKHTEVSIKRARRAYPPFPGTRQIETGKLPLPDNSADKLFVILSAHEIRNEEERIIFFRELKRIIKADGRIYITEHLRDLPNFIAYNIGFFHFHSRNSWLKTFEGASLKISKEIKLTPFISTFILVKNGNTF
ncbi:MAG: methyltransferase domain-containing protein [Cytophagaceae bacterium]